MLLLSSISFKNVVSENTCLVNIIVCVYMCVYVCTCVCMCEPSGLLDLFNKKIWLVHTSSMYAKVQVSVSTYL